MHSYWALLTNKHKKNKRYNVRTSADPLPTFIQGTPSTVEPAQLQPWCSMPVNGAFMLLLLLLLLQVPQMVCTSCGKPCRSDAEKALHTKYTGHTEFEDKVGRTHELTTYAAQ